MGKGSKVTREERSEMIGRRFPTELVECTRRAQIPQGFFDEIPDMLVRDASAGPGKIYVLYASEERWGDWAADKTGP